MVIKNYFRKGLIIIGIYLLVTFCLLLSAKRIERLEYNYTNSNIQEYKIDSTNYSK